MSIHRAFLTSKRTEIWTAQDGRCCYCKTPLKRRDATLEHVHPQSLGGLDWDENLKVSCGVCNTAKGNMPEKSFKKKRKSAKYGDFNMMRAQLRYRIEKRIQRAQNNIRSLGDRLMSGAE